MEIPNFIGATHTTPNVSDHHPVFNPSSGDVIAQVPLGGEAEVDQAVAAATRAFPNWANMPVTKRAAILFKYKHLLDQNLDELAALITKENGKTLAEAQGDIMRGIEVVDFACGIAHLSKGESLPQVAESIDAITMREPIGVCAGITPFNFPAMVPMWMYPIAIACGNTFILKPSEKVPLTALRLVELFYEAGLPDGVLNLVNGANDVVNALCSHPGITAISFVGSSHIAQHVYTLGAQHGKRVQAAGGAKNILLVMPDAEPESSLNAILGSAFGCAGQRCMAGSILMAVGNCGDEWRERISEAVNAFTLGDTSQNPDIDMGPVIDDLAKQRVIGKITNAFDGGSELVTDGREVEQDNGFFVGPTLIDKVTQNMPIFSEEIFGPVLSFLRPETLQEAIAMAKTIPYGNGATIFTSSGGAARQFSQEMPCGMIGVNVGVPAPMSLFSFSGWNESFFGDLHVQGMEGVMFYTRQKVVLSRWDKNYVRQQGW
jgi:malonate-semialdehyde dehydrogenase (acetylating) / methylmalonate-semialdehyde dehydrogenase